MKRRWLVTLLSPLVAAPAMAQHASPAIPVAELEVHSRNVTALYQWPDLATAYPATGAEEEVRLWMGGGSNWPGAVLRIVRITDDSASGQVAMWWQKDGIVGALWGSVEGDSSEECGRVMTNITVEGCRLGPTPNHKTNFADLLASEYGRRLRDAVFDHDDRRQAEADSAFLMVEYRLGDRFVRAVALTTDSPEDLAMPAYCLYEKAVLVGTPAAPEDSPECD